MTHAHKRKINNAREVAKSLQDLGNHFAANVVLELCRASEGSMIANRQLFRDNADLRGRVAALRSQVAFAYDTLVEINPSNYDHDDVCRMNDASVEVMLALKETKTIKEREGEGC